MRKIVFTLVALAFAMLADSGAGQAQTYYDYPWCAAYNSRTKNCGFMTFEQCLATIRGIGGFCQPNPFYRPRPKARRNTPS